MTKNKDVSIVLCGEAGQGIDIATNVIIKSLKSSEINLFSIKEYMSRIRGGCNSSQIRISNKSIYAPLDRIDFLIALSDKATSHFAKKISTDTYIFYNSDEIEITNNCKKIPIPLSETFKKIGGKMYTNIIYAGLILGLLDLDFNLCSKVVSIEFSKLSKEIIDNNIQALKFGHQKGTALANSNDFEFQVNKDNSIKEKLLITGNDAISIGAIAGGCDFISSYPMSPATGILTYLSQKANNFNIISEQTEDEIAAINMAIGAWYAGARAMVTTSGGGFDLMCEAVSLAGMIESPIVIHIAQRPGPATGLPTRTEQGDLDLALYSGHGEFPRIILTPGNAQDAFELTQNAFNLADKYQVPVFILSDQYLIDGHTLTSPFNIDKTKINESIIKTEENYKRYKLTENGISPRGIPNHGSGLVNVDSDEHDEDGHITEDLELRVKMVDKRLKKHEMISKAIYPPELIGNSDYETLLIGWGSTYGVLKEAIENINNNIAYLYLKQVYPLHPSLIDYLNQAKQVIIVENNATAQLAKLIRRETGFNITHKILKYNGLPFYIDELTAKIAEIIKEK